MTPSQRWDEALLRGTTQIPTEDSRSCTVDPFSR